MPAPVSHRRPIAVHATAATRSVAQEIGALRADYVGPTGIQSVLQVALGAAGDPRDRALGAGAALRGRHAVAARDPGAARAPATSSPGSTVDLRGLDEQIDSYLEQVESGLADRPDVAALVTQLEEAAGPEDLPSGDDLAREIERFLRDEG